MADFDLDGFSNEALITQGLSAPIALGFLPDNRMLVVEKGGEIFIADPNSGDKSLYLDISNIVNSGNERGLLEIAIPPDFDPDTPGKNEIYLYYTRSADTNRAVIGSFEHVEGAGGLTSYAEPNSETILWTDRDPYVSCCHYGGGLDFGPDGKLWLTTSDKFNTTNPGEGPTDSDDWSADLESTSGKVIRINRDGSIPDGTDGWPANPYVDGVIDGPYPTLNLDGQPFVPDPSIWAYGLRNPFRADWDEEYGKFYIGEVGGNQSVSTDDIHVATLDQPGAFFGWNFYEGVNDTLVSDSNAAFDLNDFPLPDGDLADPSNGDYYSTAIYDIPHSSLTAGFVYRGSMFPAEFDGVYFFGNYEENYIRFLDLNETGDVVDGVYDFKPSDDIGGGVTNVVFLEEGIDGALYYINYSNTGGRVQRIIYEGGQGNQAPTIDSFVLTDSQGDPNDGNGPNAPLEVTFNAVVSDADNLATDLTYTLSFGDGTPDITGTPDATGAITVQHTYSAEAFYNASLTVNDGVLSTFSQPITITVGDPNDPPEIVSAVSDVRFADPGDTVTFTVFVTDADADDPVSSLTYTFDFGDGTPVQTGSPDAQGKIEVTHTYPDAGNYNAFLTVSDGEADPVRSDNIPIQVGATSQLPVTDGLVFQVEAFTKVGNVGTTVTEWLDQSGFGNNLQATGDPQLVANATPSGQPAIAFDGNGDSLFRENTTSTPLEGLPTGNTPRSMYFVVDYKDTNGGTATGVAYGEGTSNSAFGLVASSKQEELGIQGWGRGNDFRSGEDAIGNNDGSPGDDWFIHSVRYDGTTIRHYRDNQLIDTANHQFATGIEKIVIGEEIANLGFGALDVAAAFVYNKELTNAEHTQTVEYLTQKYLTLVTTNQLPTVALANTLTSLPENADLTSAIKVADIVITDDGLGTNTLSLTGDDAGLFEIVGTEVFLAGGTTLDAATNASLDITIEVDDTAVGLTPDDSAALAITVVPPATNQPPTIALANTLTSLSENADLTSALKVADIVITDDGLGTNTLSLTGDDAGLFEIVGTEVLLAAGTTLDAATNASLDIGVQVDDTTVGTTPDDTATLVIAVTPAGVNQAPDAVDDTYTATAGQTLTVPVSTGLLDNDVDDGPLTITEINGQAVVGNQVTLGNSTLTVNMDGAFSYTADIGFTGSESFTYTVSDGSQTDTATVDITVNEPSTNNVPVIDGLVAQLESDINVLQQNGVVTEWLSVAGTNMDLVASGDPILVQGATPSGQAAVSLDGGLAAFGETGAAEGDKLERTSPQSLPELPTGNEARSMYFVVDYKATGGTYAGVAYGAGASNETFGLVAGGKNDELGVQGWGRGNDFRSGEDAVGNNDGSIGDDWFIHSVRYDGTTLRHYRDDQLIDTANHQFATGVDKFVIGEEIAGIGFGALDVAAVLVYDKELNDTEHAQTLQYLTQKYLTPSQQANQAPSVVLNNSLATLTEDTDLTTALKVADIVVTDDGQGTNALSLTGADAGLFEITGTELFLRAGTILDADANASLDVEVQVDDASVGTTPDGTAALAISVTAASGNQVPSVVLNNSLTSLAEDTDLTTALKVADIVVTDDGQGTNVLSLTGADESLFEIMGTELFLKAGTTLDATTNSSLDILIEVDDATVGATPDDTAALTISVTSVPPQQGGNPFTSGLIAAFEVDANVDVNSSNVLTRWGDSSGSVNNYDLDSVNGDPTLLASGTPSGQSAIAFDGNDDFLRIVGPAEIAGLPEGDEARTMYFVVDYETAGEYTGFSYGDNQKDEVFGLVTDTDDLLAIEGWGGRANRPSTEEGITKGWMVHSVVLDGSSYSHFIHTEVGLELIDSGTDGVFDTDISAADASLSLGGKVTGSDAGEMTVAAALIYDSALSAQNHADVSNYLFDKYLAVPVVS
ncbi:PQQ-dependent sugar dehydrogenase [Oscillatoria sp. CS-180]|uniref:PQQ-dependent sugar dehydrogenase n=1 Tax=Oscillatoria sp. CS-180 TaxID=3021720 RepID=UPI00232C56AD|nr:PQQ-dependent sugar dehydrogenase [Oscillatoria sp. CS-180]MDB9527400.1 PQQ-dependent sugar dehydrogenase [Oscillatoria sp. CS-180]